MTLNNADSNFTVLATPVGEDKIAISVSPSHRNSRATSLPLLRHSFSLCLQSYTTFVDRNLYFDRSASLGNFLNSVMSVNLSISCVLDTPSTLTSSSSDNLGGAKGFFSKVWPTCLFSKVWPSFVSV